MCRKDNMFSLRTRQKRGECSVTSVSVLYVDADPTRADHTATQLERESDRLSVDTVSSAREGRTALADGDVDCVVSASDLGETTGIEFLRAVRKEYPELPVIVVDATTDESVARRAISAGATEYLNRRPETDQSVVLTNRIENAVESYRNNRDLERVERIVHASGDAVYATDADGRYTFVNDAVERVTGYDSDDLVGEHVSTLIDPADVDRGEDLIRSLLRTDRTRGTFEMTVTTADGERIRCENNLTLLPEEDGFRGTVGVVRDISERVERKRELEQSNALLSTLFDALPVGVLVEDSSRTIQAVNSQMNDLFDLCGSPEEIVGDDCEQLARAVSELFADPEAFYRRVTSVVTAGDPIDREAFTLSDGRTLEWSYRPIEFADGDGHLWMFRDVSERKRRKAELKATERQFEAVFNNRFAFKALLEPDGTVREVNETARSFVGERHADVVGVPFWETPWWDHSSDLQANLRSWIDRAADGELTRYEATHYGTDGERVIVDGVFHPIRDDEGTVVSILAAGRDITDRKRHEETIRSLHEVATDLAACSTRADVYERTVTAVDTILEFDLAVMLVADDGRLRVERLSEEMPPAEIPSLSVEDSIAGMTYRDGRSYRFDDVTTAEVATPLIDARAAMSVPVGEYGVFQVLEREAGAFTERDLELAELLVRHAERALDRLDRERELEAQNERLDEFAAVVSHDLRNPLNVANGHLEMLREAHDDDRLDEIAHAHERMQSLIDDLLTVAREGQAVNDVRIVELEEVSRSCWRNVETTATTLEVASTTRLAADPPRLKQLLENLLRNAVSHGDADTITVGALEEGFYVADDGRGIAPDARDRIFDSGYSESPDGNGLGLRIVDEIVSAHDWTIDVTASVDDGARFEIRGVGGPEHDS